MRFLSLYFKQYYLIIAGICGRIRSYYHYKKLIACNTKLHLHIYIKVKHRRSNKTDENNKSTITIPNKKYTMISQFSQDQENRNWHVRKCLQQKIICSGFQFHSMTHETSLQIYIKHKTHMYAYRKIHRSQKTSKNYSNNLL